MHKNKPEAIHHFRRHNLTEASANENNSHQNFRDRLIYSLSCRGHNLTLCWSCSRGARSASPAPHPRRQRQGQGSHLRRSRPTRPPALTAFNPTRFSRYDRGAAGQVWLSVVFNGAQSNLNLKIQFVETGIKASSNEGKNISKKTWFLLLNQQLGKHF